MISGRAVLLIGALAGCGRVGFGGGSAIDAAPTDGSGDAGARVPLAAQAIVENNCSSCATLTTTFAIPPALTTELLLVVTAIGESSSGASPFTSTLTYGGTPLGLVNREVATDPSFQPVQEHWILRNPGASGDLVVTLPTMTGTLVVAAILLTGIDPTTPVSGSTGAEGKGQGAVSAIVGSAPGDLVVTSVCAGASVDAPGTGLTPLFSDELGNVSTCGNVQGAITPGTATTAAPWLVNGSTPDLWIDIATSFQQPP